MYGYEFNFIDHPWPKHLLTASTTLRWFHMPNSSTAIHPSQFKNRQKNFWGRFERATFAIWVSIVINQTTGLVNSPKSMGTLTYGNEFILSITPEFFKSIIRQNRSRLTFGTGLHPQAACTFIYSQAATRLITSIVQTARACVHKRLQIGVICPIFVW